MAIPFLLLQKPSFKSKSRDNSDCLTRRLSLLEKGDFDAIVRESRTIQSELCQNFVYPQPQYLPKTFAKHMLQGKVNENLRRFDEEAWNGVLPLDQNILMDLKSKHPTSKDTDDIVVLKGNVPFTDHVVFNNIDESSIAKAALRIKVAAGPSGLDADDWS